MIPTVFIAGMFVGAIVGAAAVAMCKMASNDNDDFLGDEADITHLNKESGHAVH